MKKLFFAANICLIVCFFTACGSRDKGQQQDIHATESVSSNQKAEVEEQKYPVDLVTEKWNNFVEFEDGDAAISRIEKKNNVIIVTILVDMATLKGASFADDILTNCYILDENNQKFTMSGDISRKINNTNIVSTIEFLTTDSFDIEKAAFVFEDTYWGLMD